MKLLLVVMDERRALIDQLYEEIRSRLEQCDILRLTPGEQDNLEDYFSKNVCVESYDRIAFMIRFKKIKKQTRFLRKIENLTFIEFDACQNYMKVKNAGEFSRLYSATPWCRVISTGYGVAKKLVAEGFDVKFTPKGYDHTALKNANRTREIELGFIGSTHNSIYKERVKLLQQISKIEPLVIDFEADRQRYVEKLNNIRFFVAPDKGFGEYMVKCFEAMACGCLLLTYDQGEEENKALGFLDMVNVVLFRNLEEFSDKLAILRQNPVLADQIAAAGQGLVSQQYTFSHWGQRIVDALKPPLQSPLRNPSYLEQLYLRLRAYVS